MQGTSTRYGSGIWRDVARFVDRHEKEELLRHLAETDPVLHSRGELLQFAHGDWFLLRDMLSELKDAGVIQKLPLRDGPYYSLASIPGLRDKVLALQDYFAELHRVRRS
jgi:hypothetical protein